MAGRLQVIQATPGLEAVRGVLSRLKRNDPTYLTAMSGTRVGVLRELLETDESLEVAEFGQLVGQVVTRLGGHALGLPNQGHLRAALAQAAGDLPATSPFFETAATPGFLRLVGGLLDDLRGYGIEADEIRAAAGYADESLAPKLSDLASIQESIAHSMAMLGKRFNRERIEACYEHDDGPELDLDIVAWAGSDDAPLALDWLKWVSERGARVTVIVEAHPTNATLFEGGHAIVERLGANASPLPIANDLSARLFAETKFPGQTRPLAVNITVAPDELAEVEWAIRTLSAEIEDGIPARRIAIVSRNLQSYAPLLEASAKRMGFPVSCARSVPLLSNGFVRFVLHLLQALTSRDVRRLVPLLRSSYLRMPRTAVGELESIIQESHRVRDDSWEALEQAARAQIAPESADWLLPVLEWRRAALAEAITLDQWAERIRDLGDQAWLAGALEMATPTQVRDGYAQNAMQRTLADAATMERLRGGRPRNLESFVREAVRLWEETEVLLPQDPEGVRVVNSGGALGDVDIVWVLGMLEGVFPRRRKENPILHDEELAWLSGHFGVKLVDGRRRAREERDEFYRVACAPAKKLWLSYPQTGDDRDNVPAFYLQEVERLMEVSMEVHSRQELVPAEPKLEADRKLAAAFAAERLAPRDLSLVTDLARDLIRKESTDSFTIRELVSVLQCPFRYVAASRLRINPPRTTTRWNQLLNLPAKIGLASQPSEQAASEALLGALDDLLTDLYGECTETDLTLMRAGGKRLIREWVDREFAARRLWPREEVVTTGLEMGGEHLKESLKLPTGETLNLTGEFPVLSKREQGFHVLHMFRQQDPIPDGNRNDPFDHMSDEDALELAITIFAIRGSRNRAIEIDCANSRVRRLIYMGDTNFFQAENDGLRSSRIEADQVKPLGQKVSERAAEAVRKIATGKIDANPGTACERCDFGELCRRAQNYSDINDPFAREVQREA